MAYQSMSPDEVLKFWRELKGVIKDNVDMSQVYDLHEIVSFALENKDALESLTSELENKRYKDMVIGLARCHGLCAEDLE